MNELTLLGYVTQKPETKQKEDGTIGVLRHGLAVRKPCKKGEEAESEFFNLSAFGKTAEFAEKYLDKGVRVLVKGHIRTNNYEDREGKKHYGIDLIADSYEIVSWPKKEEETTDE